MQKSKMAVWGGLTKAVKRREAKNKGEKERYKPLNTEFQRIARRDKKAFFSDQGKEIDENNRMGKTRDLFKKIRDTKGTFHAKMGSIKDRNGMDLTKAEDMADSEEELKSLLMKVKEESEKLGLKLNIQETRIMTSVPITSWQIEGETMETVTDFIFLGFKITVDGDFSHEIKRHLLLRWKLMINLGNIL